MNALIVVDLQNDFCTGGALAVPEGEAVVPLANRLQPIFDLVVATQDWHPRDHASFATNHPGKNPGDLIELTGLQQVLWPMHCVQGTTGAEFHPALDKSRIAKVFPKGTNSSIDSYSGFFDNGHRQATGLADYLKSQGVRRVYVCGLATDYCVKFTALDAVGLDFETYLVEDVCRGVNLQPNDSRDSIQEMRDRGVVVIQAAELFGGTTKELAVERHSSRIEFYKVGNPYGEFSNFAPFPIDLDGKTWPTSEHYFQAQKFVGTEHAETIRLNPSPSTAAKLGRSRKHPLRTDWEQAKDAIMYRAVLAKFTQHDRLLRMLLATGDAHLIEHTKNDFYWADGGDGSGKNMLGAMLMQVRDKLRQGH